MSSGNPFFRIGQSVVSMSGLVKGIVWCVRQAWRRERAVAAMLKSGVITQAQYQARDFIRCEVGFRDQRAQAQDMTRPAHLRDLSGKQADRYLRSQQRSSEWLYQHGYDTRPLVQVAQREVAALDEDRAYLNALHERGAAHVSSFTQWTLAMRRNVARDERLLRELRAGEHLRLRRDTPLDRSQFSPDLSEHAWSFIEWMDKNHAMRDTLHRLADE